MNIVLTGFMGTGKSAVGQLIARKLGWQFFDTDALIEDETGLSIAVIFARHGEPYFRELESRTVMLLSLLDTSVISCGGGVVLKKENMDELEQRGIIVCLTASPKTILERIKHEQNRPLLQGKDPLSRVQELLTARADCYGRAHVTVATDVKTVEAIADEIIAFPSIASQIKK
jgi:shikimate kinase